MYLVIYKKSCESVTEERNRIFATYIEKWDKRISYLCAITLNIAAWPQINSNGIQSIQSTSPSSFFRKKQMRGSEGGLPYTRGQPAIHSEFQATLGYIVRIQKQWKSEWREE